MCTRPIEQDGNTFACRTCDECIATRRHGWVSRAMAEKAMHRHALCVALTYGNKTQEQRDASRMFCYADVRAFLARLRSDLRRRFGSGNYTLRFLCAGEQGDRFGRCHWHLILFSDHDLTQCGVFTQHGRSLPPGFDLFTRGKRKVRLDWSMWGNGFVTLQEPDEGGMAYVLSYCLKDQFIGEKARGTMREATAENFATGLFRMSKRPAIGNAWLMQKLAALDATGSVLPSLQLKIPGASGYWYPSGTFRERLLWALVALNQRAIWHTGANAPQWAALLASCRDSEKDMEILNVKEEDPDEETLESKLQRRAREEGERARVREIVRTCAARIPCRFCLHHVGLYTLEKLGIRRIVPEDGGPWEYTSLPGHPDIYDRWRSPEHRGNGINPLCQKKGGAEYARHFPASGT